MESHRASVSFSCKRCGTKLTWPDDAQDATIIGCTHCGFHFGTYADLRHTAMEDLRKRIGGAFKESVKRR
jgi:DNA-directed RNA polymerase subunit RPC12/RpoP